METCKNSCDPSTNFGNNYCDDQGCKSYTIIYLLLFLFSFSFCLTNLIFIIRKFLKKNKYLTYLFLDSRYICTLLCVLGNLVYFIRHVLLVIGFSDLITMAVLLGLGLVFWISAYMMYLVFMCQRLRQLFIQTTNKKRELQVSVVIKLLYLALVLIIITWVLSFLLYWNGKFSNIFLICFGFIVLMAFTMAGLFYNKEYQSVKKLLSPETKSKLKGKVQSSILQIITLLIFSITMLVQTIWIPSTNNQTSWLILNRFILWLLGLSPAIMYPLWFFNNSKSNKIKLSNISIKKENI